MDLNKIVDEEIKKHNHNGVNSDKINASNIDIDTTGCSFINSSKVDKAIKDLDAILSLVNNRIQPAENNIMVGNGDKIVSSGKTLDDVASVIHKHDEYVAKPTGKNNTIAIVNNGRITGSDVTADDIVAIKELLKNVKKVSGEPNSVLVLDSDNNIVCSSVNVSRVSDISHNHDSAYIQKTLGDGEIAILQKNGNVSNSGIRIDSLATKKDTDVNIGGRIGNILVKDENGKPVASAKNVNEIADIVHNHSIKEIKDINMVALLQSGDVIEYIKSIVREEIRSMLKNV